RPLVGLRQQNFAFAVSIQFGPQLLDDLVSLWKILVVGAVALAKIGNGVETESVNAGVKPALHHLNDRTDNAGIVEIQIGLMREESVPVKLTGYRIPGPV